jgi:hypothetical protein
MRPLLSTLALAFVVASPVAVLSQTYTGPITVTDTADNTVLGYVSSGLNSFGEYGVVSTTTGALNVTFNESSSPFNITLNSPANPSFNYFGGIQGFSSTSPDLGAGSYNYSYLGESNPTGPGATPSDPGNSFTAATGIPEDSESAIWSVDAATGELTPQWINSDSSSPVTYAMDITNILVLTGDPSDFQGTFGAATPIEFSIPASPPATPEPSSFLLLGTGIVSLLGAARRRLKA